MTKNFSVGVIWEPSSSQTNCRATSSGEPGNGGGWSSQGTTSSSAAAAPSSLTPSDNSPASAALPRSNDLRVISRSFMARLLAMARCYGAVDDALVRSDTCGEDQDRA